ncbi:hypothetical protein PVK06_029580 [Gossypium arboreum]|uniref:Transmembrane protein n=1 Tax=Gossypium arboreum TaxID=29729 RepID=A0ABR0P741_GOSAR|nr:hypothetical protein PVK06_029580 [Gossypium arboreum]
MPTVTTLEIRAAARTFPLYISTPLISQLSLPAKFSFDLKLKKKIFKFFSNQSTMASSMNFLMLLSLVVFALMAYAMAAEAPAPSPTSGSGSFSPSLVSVFAVVALLFGSALRF